MSLPSLTEISPAAQVALLHTLMYSGFRLPERMGMNSEKKKQLLESIKDVRTWYARVDVREARLGEVAQQSKT